MKKLAIAISHHSKIALAALLASYMVVACTAMRCHHHCCDGGEICFCFEHGEDGDCGAHNHDCSEHGHASDCNCQAIADIDGEDHHEDALYTSTLLEATVSDWLNFYAISSSSYKFPKLTVSCLAPPLLRLLPLRAPPCRL